MGATLGSVCHRQPQDRAPDSALCSTSHTEPLEELASENDRFTQLYLLCNIVILTPTFTPSPNVKSFKPYLIKLPCTYRQ